jgi:hypothetical protein
LFVGGADFWLRFSWGSLSVMVLRQVRTEMPSLEDWAEGRFWAFFNPLRVKEESSLIFAERIVGHSSDACVIGLCGEN